MTDKKSTEIRKCQECRFFDKLSINPKVACVLFKMIKQSAGRNINGICNSKQCSDLAAWTVWSHDKCQFGYRRLK